jgi:outer membrane protein insertion porin family
MLSGMIAFTILAAVASPVLPADSNPVRPDMDKNVQSVIVAGKTGRITIDGLQSINREELLYLLDIMEGRPLDASRLRAGIKRAFLKGIFTDIIVESSGKDSNDLKITIKERPVISSIDIQGNNQIPTKLISKTLSIKKGQRYNANMLANTAAELREIIIKKGYPQSRVTYSAEKTGRNKVVVKFTINEGSPLTIKEIKISGDADIAARHIRLSAGDTYDSSSLQEVSEKIRAELKGSSYIGGRMSYTFNNGTLDIRLSKGAKLAVSFEGNSTMSSDTLMKEVPFLELDSFSYDLLEETVRRIVNIYHKDGYTEVQIAPVVKESGNNTAVKFYINEGVRYRVDKLEFEGTTLPADKLKAIVQLQQGEYFNPDLLGPDDESIREFYRSLGYLYTESKEPAVDIKENNVSVKFRYIEGIQVKLSRVDIKDNREIPTEKIIAEIPLKKGNAYNEIDILNSRIRILDLYHKKGFLDAVVTIEKSISGTEAIVTFNVREGTKTLFGKTVIIGNEDTSVNVITRSLTHKEDAPFNYSLILSERQKLYRTGLFSGVDIQLADRFGQNRDVLYRIEEGDAGAFEFGLGYAEYEKLRGFFDVSYKNLFGMNREVSFRTDMSTLNRRFMLSYFEPWFLNENIAFKTQLIKEYRKEINIDTREVRYRLDRYSALAGLEKKLSDKIKGEVYYELTQVRTYDVKPDIVLSHEDTGTLLISAVKAGLIFDSRDNPFEPRSGLLAGLTYKIATSALLSETNFNKVQLYVNKYQALAKPIVLAVSLRGGYATSLDRTPTLPLVERFFLGGRTTVRGYDQDSLGPKGGDNNPTGGNIFLMGNAEVRIDIWKGFGLVAFLDAGNVWQNSDEFSMEKIKYTTGLGLRYNTPVGPIRIDYGLKLTRQKGEGAGALHFSVGHAF